MFKNFPGEHAPGPSGAFFCSSTCFKLILPEKTTALEKMLKFGVPSLKKISDYASDMKHFQRTFLITPFYRVQTSTIFAFTVGNIRPNSELHLPTKIF